MYAIETYFLAPTNHLGPRIVARVMERGTGYGTEHGVRKLVLHWDHALNPAANHQAAVAALAAKLGWDGEWVEGGSDHGASVWVNISRGMPESVTVPPAVA